MARRMLNKDKDDYVAIINIISDLRRKASLGAMKLLEEARRLGVPESYAEELADKVMLYELTPEEAIRKLRILARKQRSR